jgi:hypothetical protein
MTLSYTSLAAAVLVVDAVTLGLHRIFDFGKSLSTWYSKFGIVAVMSDCLIIVLGILLAQFFVPRADTLTLAGVSLVIQMIHDVLFNIFVIQLIPAGHNTMIDLFKAYATENSWKILVADGLMITSTVFLADYYDSFPPKYVIFIGLLALYSMTYSIYTK